MDKSWMSLGDGGDEYMNGLEGFLDFALINTTTCDSSCVFVKKQM